MYAGSFIGSGILTHSASDSCEVLYVFCLILRSYPRILYCVTHPYCTQLWLYAQIIFVLNNICKKYFFKLNFCFFELADKFSIDRIALYIYYFPLHTKQFPKAEYLRPLKAMRTGRKGMIRKGHISRIRTREKTGIFYNRYPLIWIPVFFVF